MEGKQFSSSRGVVIYVRDVLARYQPDALRYFISRGRPGEPGQQLHLGGVRPPHQRRARRGLGQPGQPHRDHDRQELRRDPRRRRARPPRTRRCSTPSQAAFGDGRRPDRPAPAEGRPRRGDAHRRRGEQVRLRQRAVEAQGRRRARAARHDPARHRAGRRRLQRAARAVPAAQRQRRRPGARRRRRRRADAARSEEVEDLDGGRRRTRSSPATTPASRPGSAARSWPGTPVAKPAPVFTKLDPSVVDEELARLRASGVTLHPQAVAALALWSAGPERRRPRLRAGRHRRERAEALAAAAAWSPRSRSTGSRTSTPTGCRCRLYVPDGRASARSCSCTAAASCSATSTPTTASRGGSPTGPGRRCWRSTTGGRPSTRSRPPPTTWTPRCPGCW